ncbi:hypothetical protein [Deinococcus aquiradiocola]|uniref:Uncharacterized protein n=1 Tax=Deinococcus aquiradiocola TaxID=393059 RepID=A0A917PPV6_9DEIO|nr:hypothetical protein [Deinococcus aquiradiocola]GGJ87263.1 hypothetical protein GCM10008939_34140 [Deinococcus aquiradiocola]
MYYVLAGDWSKMPNESSIPRVEKRLMSMDLFMDVWSTEPLMKKWPEIEVSMTKRTAMLDYLATTGGLDICKRAMFGEIRKLDRNIEELPVNVVDRKSGDKIDIPYAVLHPLCSFRAFDLNKSSRRSSGKIKTLVPTEDLLASEIPILSSWLI